MHTFFSYGFENTIDILNDRFPKWSIQTGWGCLGKMRERGSEYIYIDYTHGNAM